MQIQQKAESCQFMNRQKSDDLSYIKPYEGILLILSQQKFADYMRVNFQSHIGKIMTNLEKCKETLIILRFNRILPIFDSIWITH